MGLNFSQQLVTRYALEIANIVDMVSSAAFIPKPASSPLHPDLFFVFFLLILPTHHQ